MPILPALEKKLLTRPERFVRVDVMSHCNTATITQQMSRVSLVSRLVGARFNAILVLVLVLLITNGGAG
jgi:hypothetical protein